MKLSVIIPAHNEEENIAQAVKGIREKLSSENIIHEIVVINDNSSDNTRKVAEALVKTYSNIKLINRKSPCGFGRAVREGLLNVTGDVVAIVMGDLSDDPADIVKCFKKIEQGCDCVFGSRFTKGSKVESYPPLKLFINRMANTFIKILFCIKHNDTTNAFKLYRKEVINAVQPLQSLYFNITAELPLKAIVRGFSYCQVPINWYGRKSGVSKLSIKDMGKKYLFAVLCVWIEKVILKKRIKKFHSKKKKKDED